MTSFRYHVVSLVSVLLALAVGVVLGGGPLRGETDARVAQVAGGRHADPGLAGQVSALRRSEAFTDGFAATVAPTVLRTALRGHDVTVVALPTASRADVTELVRLVKVAGGRVGGTFDVGRQLVDVTQKGLVDQLGSQLEARVRGMRIPGDAGPYDRIGALVGRAVGSGTRGGAPVDGAATTITAGLRTAGLLTPRSAQNRRGDLVLFVTGPGPDGAQARKGAATIVSSLVRAVDGVTGGTVLAGPPAATGPSGQITALRDDAAAGRTVSTVDTVDGRAGQVVTVLALAQQAAGGTGHYGDADAPDGAAPGEGPGASR
jgi:hypothetical protein